MASIEEVIAAAELRPPDERLTFLQGYLLGIDDPEARKKAELALLVFTTLCNRAPVGSTVVVLIHGIRTQGEWQEKVAKEFGVPGVTVYPIKFEFFDILRFILPGPTRRLPL